LILGRRPMKIRAVTPVITESFGPLILEEFSRVAGPATEISNVFLRSGPASVESAYDEAVAIPDVIARVCEAEAEGMDAVIINCFGDPGLDAAREVVSIPVVGPCEASMHVAAMLGHKFSVITVLERLIPELDLHAQKYGVASKLASGRSVELPVLDLEKGRQQFVGRMIEKAIEAVEEDGAHVIVLGCTGLAGLAEQVKAGLARRGFDIPVIDPAATALKLAEALVGAGLTHSKRTYPQPPPKEIIGYQL
jgi:allantoin racemase